MPNNSALSAQQQANVTRLLAELADRSRIATTPVPPNKANTEPQPKIVSRRTKRTIIKGLTAPTPTPYANRAERRMALNHPNQYRRKLGDAIPRKDQYLVREIRKAFSKPRPQLSEDEAAAMLAAIDAEDDLNTDYKEMLAKNIASGTDNL